MWLLASEGLVERHSRLFARYSKIWVKQLHRRYDILWNMVDARNRVHIRWLEWCGFTLLRRLVNHGVEQRLFYEFERVASVGDGNGR